ncbi:zinc-binding dehydrogenase [Orbus sturtevantii]|uniref:alcohol dehydrogenase catalytic domain-containing protein n=1 Tax=Orbus sturtevantii TaxID=3074109 RepID=UPI00370DCE54
MPQMNAWLYSNNTIKLARKAIPTVGEHSVLVKNSAIGLNPVDWKLIAGNLGHFNENLIPGVDGMGTIIAVGKHVPQLRINSRVAYHTDLRQDGSYSEYTLVDGRALIPVPDGISDIAAAAFPCPGLTAWQAVQKLPQLSGKRILVNGAGGAVGRIICQLLIALGAKVYAVASEKHHALLSQIGAVQCVDYHHRHWLDALSTIRFYAAFDMVNGESAARLAPLLEYYGHLVSIQDRVDKSPLPPFTASISLHEIALAAQHVYGSDQQWQQLMQAGHHLLQQIQVGALSLPTIESVSFKQIDKALDNLKNRNDGTKYVALFD